MIRISFRSSGMRRESSERGDTIIEVLIAIGIVSLVLTSAYVLTNRNVQANQEVQEQAYAQKLIEQQVELLRAAGTKPMSNGCFSAPNSFVAAGSPMCSIRNGGAVYKLNLSPQASLVYKATATWSTVGGSNADVTVYYKVSS